MPFDCTSWHPVWWPESDLFDWVLPREPSLQYNRFCAVSLNLITSWIALWVPWNALDPWMSDSSSELVSYMLSIEEQELPDWQHWQNLLNSAVWRSTLCMFPLWLHATVRGIRMSEWKDMQHSCVTVSWKEYGESLREGTTLHGWKWAFHDEISLFAEVTPFLIPIFALSMLLEA